MPSLVSPASDVELELKQNHDSLGTSRTKSHFDDEIKPTVLHVSSSVPKNSNNVGNPDSADKYK